MAAAAECRAAAPARAADRKSTRLNSSHSQISYAVFCLKKKKICIQRYLASHDSVVDLGRFTFRLPSTNIGLKLLNTMRQLTLRWIDEVLTFSVLHNYAT